MLNLVRYEGPLGRKRIIDIILFLNFDLDLENVQREFLVIQKLLNGLNMEHRVITDCIQNTLNNVLQIISLTFDISVELLKK